MFSYAQKDFNHQELSWENRLPLSKFDEKLEGDFEKAMANGVLRYKQPKDFNEIKIVETAHGLQMAAEFNPNRGFNKRPRDPIPTINHPFDPAKFNFNRIAEKEILFKLEPSNDLIGSRGDEPYLAIVNVSPINFCHCLYIIEPLGNHLQRLTSKAVRAGYDLMRLTSQPGFRVMFNSLHAWASVNHLHLHSMLVDHELGMDSCPSIKICEKDIIRKLGEKSHLEGYVINWDMKSDLEQIVSAVDSVIQYFHKNEIPYNTLWTRGKDEGTGNSTQFLRLFIWPRASAEGKIPDPAFDNACAELAGHLPIKVKAEFDQLTGESAEKLISRAKLDEETAMKIEMFMSHI